jgi:hypothetical protein
MDWLKFVATWSSVGLGVLALYEGSKQIAFRGISRTRLGLFVLGLILVFTDGARLAWTSHMGLKALEAIESGSMYRPTKEHIAQLPPTEREQKTLFVARLNFQNHGVLTPYFAADGAEMLYAPSQGEISQREQLQFSVIRTRAQLEFNRALGYIVSLFGLLAFVAGVLYGRMKRMPKHG